MYTHISTVKDRSSLLVGRKQYFSSSHLAKVFLMLHSIIGYHNLEYHLLLHQTEEHSSILQYWQIWVHVLEYINSVTTACDPQANGMIERFHRQVKDALRACLGGSDWNHHSSPTLFFFRTKVYPKRWFCRFFSRVDLWFSSCSFQPVFRGTRPSKPRIC